MTGRGRPRKKTETPKDTTKDTLKAKNAKRCCGKAKLPERSAETTEKQPDVKVKSPKKIVEEQGIPKSTTEEEATKAKRCADKTKSAEEFTDKTKMAQAPKREDDDALNTLFRKTPEKDTTKDTLKAKNAKKCCGKAKLPERSAEATEKKPVVKVKSPKKIVEEQGIPKSTTEEEATKAKRCADQTKSAEEFTDKTKMAQTPKREDDDALNTLLRKTVEKLKIKRDEKADAAKVVNEIVKNITTHLKNNTECFKEVQEPLSTGSYYENLKISSPDEFDFMLPMPVNRVTINPFGDDGAFYSVELKRGESPLKKFQENSVLSASEMLKEFRAEVVKCVKGSQEWEVTRKKKGCPAVTLTRKLQSITISLDVVLCLMVKSSWPAFTKEGLKIEGWLGTKVKQENKRKPYYLVPKYEGRGNVENDGVLAKDTWRISFSHVEKAIMKNHGSEKTCCEKHGAHCCRKDCVKLLKHLLRLLKERHSSFDKFCSYHAKTTVLHACATRTKDSDWSASTLSHCFQLLLKDFIAHLEKASLSNFFIPTQNLLYSPGQNNCKKLANCIREECDRGFPIFK